MPSSYMSTDGLRKICGILLVLSLLAAACTLFLRIRAEASSREVELVVDYNEIAALASWQGKPMADVLATLREHGATGVALQEETLNTLLAQGVITILPHQEMSAPAALNAKDWAPDEQVFDIQTSGLHTNLWLFAALQRAYAPANVSASPPSRIFVAGPRDMVSNLGLGLAQAKVDCIRQAGLRVIPRLHGGNLVSTDSLRASLDAVQRMIAAPGGKYPYYGTIIFDGSVVPGYRQLIPDLARLLRERKMIYGSIEFGKQKGDTELGARMDTAMLRVHSIAPEELSTLYPSQAVQRFALAVKDRNIRVLYVHLPPVAGADVVADAATYTHAIAAELRHEGFVINAQKPAHPFRALHTPKLLLVLLFLGAGASLLYWLLSVLPSRVTPAMHRAGYVLLILGVLAALVTGCTHFSGIGRAVFALLAAISFPLLSLTWAYRVVDRFVAERPAQPLWPAIKMLCLATLITLGGALLVAATMSESHYLMKIGEFVGVKIALGVPLLLFAVLLAADGVARRGEDWHAYLTRCRQQLLSCLRQPLYLWSITLAVVTLAAVALLLARSGNDSGVGASNFELHLRAMLEQWMYARPRTKEFAFGHPFFIFALVAAARGYRLPALLLLLGAAVGQTDVLNTYCHAHTGVLLSLVRTFNGLWVGIALAAVLLALFAWRVPATAPAEKAPTP